MTFPYGPTALQLIDGVAEWHKVANWPPEYELKGTIRLYVSLIVQGDGTAAYYLWFRREWQYATSPEEAYTNIRQRLAEYGFLDPLTLLLERMCEESS